ncbi:hypothetical protein T439DRAFT_326033 [Meredithblackwellia eburnea MCA 4105]
MPAAAFAREPLLNGASTPGFFFCPPRFSRHFFHLVSVQHYAQLSISTIQLAWIPIPLHLNIRQRFVPVYRSGCSWSCIAAHRRGKHSRRSRSIQHLPIISRISKAKSKSKSKSKSREIFVHLRPGQSSALAILAAPLLLTFASWDDPDATLLGRVTRKLAYNNGFLKGERRPALLVEAHVEIVAFVQMA